MDGAPQSGTSIFDPVLCELAYRWFCPPGGLILDPFAGGSVRGIVASKLGRHYIGIDLRPEQIAANRAQGQAICDADMQPEWIEGDSLNLHALLGDSQQPADFIFSCPPYFWLEVYSDDPRDLSTMGLDQFCAAYNAIVEASCARLKNDRFATFVIGEVRDKKGFCVNFFGRTVEAFERAGLRLYNDAILVTSAGSLPIRAGKQFEATRKLGRTHQYVLTFCKGDPRKATAAVGKVEFGDIGSADAPAEDGDSQFGERL